MRLLDRFLLRELAIPLAYCLGGFLMFWVSFDLFSELDTYQQRQLAGRDIVELYLVRLPELLVLVIPIALLLALLYTLANHSRHHEITAMRAAGLGLWRICVPYFAVGLLFSGLLFWMNERLVPDNIEQARKIMSRRIHEAADQQLVPNLHFRNARENRIWNIGSYHPETFEMVDPQVEWRLPNGVQKTLIARRATRANGQWLFSNVQFLVYDPGQFEKTTRLQTNQMIVPEWTESPAEIQLQIKFSRLNAIDASRRPQFSLAEIKYIRTHLELNRRDHVLLETQRHARLAQPWTCLVVVLIAIPFGAASGRRNVFIGVAASIFICFAYFILLRLGLALGTGAFIPGWLAAWFPNMLFGSAGLWMTHRVR